MGSPRACWAGWKSGRQQVLLRRGKADRLRLLLVDPRGATAAEYAIMASLIAVVIVAAVAAFGGAVNGLFESAANGMP